MDLRRSRSALAYALLRELYHQYDAGGHSMRSMKSCLIESILQQAPRRLPKVIYTENLFMRIRIKVRKDRQKKPWVQLCFPFGIVHLSHQEYACVVLLAVQELNRHENETASYIERHLIAFAALLLGVSEDRERYEALLAGTSPYELVQEGRRRSFCAYRDEYGGLSLS